MAVIGGRQVGRTLAEIRADHAGRYAWAARRLQAIGSQADGTVAAVLDAACGCGYGAAILADRGLSVTAIDVAADALDWARTHWHRRSTEWIEGALPDALPDGRRYDAVVSFETVEHVEDDLGLLTAFRAVSDRLLVSVPNQAELPFDPRRFPAHYRHYTAGELAEVLAAGGWRVASWWGQAGAFTAAPTPGAAGRTLIADCTGMDVADRRERPVAEEDGGA